MQIEAKARDFCPWGVLKVDNIAIDQASCDLKRRQDKFTLRYISTVYGFCQLRNKL